jgi:hypothetical protein
MPTDADVRADTGEWPEEFYLDGPVPGGEELLRRTVAKVHRHSQRSARTRGALLVTAAVLTGVVLTGAGMAIGHSMRPVATAEPPIVAVDPLHGARLEATMSPAGGSTTLRLKLSGLPAGTECRLIVVDKDGTRFANGSWRAGAVPVEETVWLPPDRIAGFEVATSTHADLVASIG